MVVPVGWDQKMVVVGMVWVDMAADTAARTAVVHIAVVHILDMRRRMPVQMDAAPHHTFFDTPLLVSDPLAVGQVEVDRIAAVVRE